MKINSNNEQSVCTCPYHDLISIFFFFVPHYTTYYNFQFTGALCIIEIYYIHILQLHVYSFCKKSVAITV